jgi:hypothetical protein
MKISLDIGGTLTKICLFIPDSVIPFLSQDFIEFLGVEIVKGNKNCYPGSSQSPFISPSVSPIPSPVPSSILSPFAMRSEEHTSELQSPS